MERWSPLFVDLAVIASMTILASIGKVPAEAAIAVLSALAGARAATKSGHLPPGSGATLALLLGFGGMFAGKKVI